MFKIYNINIFSHWVNLVHYLYSIYVVEYEIHYNNLSEIIYKDIFCRTITVVFE